jgi:uncharacterized membrane protein
MIDLSSLNYIAIIVAGVVYFVLGAVWYGAIVNKPFLKYRGDISDDTGAAPLDYLFVFVCQLAQAFVLAIVMRLAGATTLEHGIAVGLAMAAGFGISNTFVYGNFHGVRRELWLLESAYVLIAFVVMGALLALWR